MNYFYVYVKKPSCLWKYGYSKRLHVYHQHSRACPSHKKMSYSFKSVYFVVLAKTGKFVELPHNKTFNKILNKIYTLQVKRKVAFHHVDFFLRLIAFVIHRTSELSDNVPATVCKNCWTCGANITNLHVLKPVQVCLPFCSCQHRTARSTTVQTSL